MPRGSTITELPIPTGGARSDESPHRLPPEALVANNTQNVIVRDGWLVNRPGFREVNSATVSGTPMGAFVFRTGTSRFSIIGTTTNLYKLATSGNTWDNLTGTTTPTGNANNHWRFAVFPQGGSDYVIGVNGTNTPQAWDGVIAAFIDLAGSPPPADDITIAANRVLLFRPIDSGVRQNFRVRWSNFNDRATYASTGFADLSDTPDIMVAGRSLSRIAFAIYKESSQWVGIAQSGIAPFKFELQDRKPGPVSVASVVDAEGLHYYAANDGSFYTFDGIRATHIGEPIRRWFSANLNYDRKARTFGVYARRDRSIYWFFPTPTVDSPTRAVSLNLDNGRWFPHVLGVTLTCGAEWDLISNITWASLSALTWNNVASTYSTWASFGSASTPVEIFGSSAGKIYHFGTAFSDDGTAFTAKWRTGSFQLAGPSMRARVQSLDTFFEVTSASTTVTAKVGTTDTLGADPSFPSELQGTFDPSTDALRQVNYDTATAGTGTNTAEARFACVDHSLAVNSDFKWAGGHLRSYPQETS